MKKYILIGCLSLLGSIFAMDNDMSPSEKREIRARAAEERLRLQQSGQIEGENIQEIQENVFEEGEEESEKIIEQMSIAADCIEADQQLVDSVLNPKKESNIVDLEQLCLDKLSNLYICEDPIAGRYLDVEKCLADMGKNSELLGIRKRAMLNAFCIISGRKDVEVREIDGSISIKINDKVVQDEEMNYLICYELLKNILLPLQTKIMKTEKWPYPLSSWDYKELRRKCGKVFSSDFYKQLSEVLKEDVVLSIKEWGCLDIRRGFIISTHMIEDVFSCRLYPPIKRLFHNHGKKTSSVLGLIGSFSGLVLASRVIQSIDNKYIRLPVLLSGMLVGYRLATIPIYDWERFFNYYLPNSKFEYEMEKLCSWVGALSGLTLYYFTSKSK